MSYPPPPRRPDAIVGRREGPGRTRGPACAEALWREKLQRVARWDSVTLACFPAACLYTGCRRPKQERENHGGPRSRLHHVARREEHAPASVRWRLRMPLRGGGARLHHAPATRARPRWSLHAVEGEGRPPRGWFGIEAASPAHDVPSCLATRRARACARLAPFRPHRRAALRRRLLLRRRRRRRLLLLLLLLAASCTPIARRKPRAARVRMRARGSPTPTLKL
eukprot:scaffold3428_cov379-Prasinococcus_capsulatus_cf.AAC.23